MEWAQPTPAEPMAVTKIWPIKDSIQRVVDYARNPEKTQMSDLQRVLQYAGNEEKTESEEQALFVTGVNCSADHACQEMLAVQRHFGKTGGNVAYHGYQSFKTGEVTPELCHQLGVELARRMWGEDYQVLVATHLNTGTYHNHFVVNAVNLWTGKKFDCNRGAYWRLRAISDELCREHGLVVIEHPAGKTPRSIYFSERQNEPTHFNLMRQAIDLAIQSSINQEDFYRVLRQQGYLLNSNPQRKYHTIRSVNSKKAVRLWRLGEDYDMPRIVERLRERGFQDRLATAAEYHRQRDASRQITLIRVRGRGSLRRGTKITGLRALYFHYCYLLGVIPKHRPRRPLSPALREAVRRLDRISQQVRLMAAYHLDTVQDVRQFLTNVDAQIQEGTAQRTRRYNQMRRCTDPVALAALRAERDRDTKQLSQLRTQRKTAQRLLDSLPELEGQMQAEQTMRRALYRPRKQRERYEARERESKSFPERG